MVAQMGWRCAYRAYITLEGYRGPCDMRTKQSEVTEHNYQIPKDVPMSFFYYNFFVKYRLRLTIVPLKVNTEA